MCLGELKFFEAEVFWLEKLVLKIPNYNESG